MTGQAGGAHAVFFPPAGVERADTGAVEQPRSLSPHEVSPSMGK